MKVVKQAARLLLLTVMVCAALAATAFAADDGSVWVDVAETTGGTAAEIVTDASVTDGVVELTYNSSALTYESIEVAEDYVAMYAVNTDETGAVRISWVAPEEVPADVNGAGLFQVNFTGTAEEGDITLTGSVNGADGAPVPVGEKTDEEPEPSEEPAASEEPGASEAPVDPEDPAKTGDSSNLGPMFGLLVCAVIAGAAVTVGYKRRAER